MENSQQSRQDAQRIIDYLRQRGYNTQQETAADLGMDEAQYSLAAKEIDGYHTGVRRDSYGTYVAWVDAEAHVY